METRSGPGELAAQEEPAKEDLSESKQIERFDIPLNSLKRMFEKPAVAAADGEHGSAVSSAADETRHCLLCARLCVCV